MKAPNDSNVKAGEGSLRSKKVPASSDSFALEKDGFLHSTILCMVSLSPV